MGEQAGHSMGICGENAVGLGWNALTLLELNKLLWAVVAQPLWGVQVSGLAAKWDRVRVYSEV